jgi:hypothetical protein
MFLGGTLLGGTFTFEIKIIKTSLYIFKPEMWNLKFGT